MRKVPVLRPCPWPLLQAPTVPGQDMHRGLVGEKPLGETKGAWLDSSLLPQPSHTGLHGLQAAGLTVT